MSTITSFLQLGHSIENAVPTITERRNTGTMSDGRHGNEVPHSEHSTVMDSSGIAENSPCSSFVELFAPTRPAFEHRDGSLASGIGKGGELAASPPATRYDVGNATVRLSPQPVT